MKVLFICKGNYYRSQMAAALYNKLTKTNDAFSAGTYTGAPDEPEGQVLKDLFPNPAFLNFMAEQGMDIRTNKTAHVTPAMINEANIVVSMAEEPYIPDFLRNNRKIIYWDIDNPENVDHAAVIETYKKIEPLVQGLIALAA